MRLVHFLLPNYSLKLVLNKLYTSIALHSQHSMLKYTYILRFDKMYEYESYVEVKFCFFFKFLIEAMCIYNKQVDAIIEMTNMMI